MDNNTNVLNICRKILISGNIPLDFRMSNIQDMENKIQFLCYQLCINEIKKKGKLTELECDSFISRVINQLLQLSTTHH